MPPPRGYGPVVLYTTSSASYNHSGASHQQPSWFAKSTWASRNIKTDQDTNRESQLLKDVVKIVSSTIEISWM